MQTDVTAKWNDCLAIIRNSLNNDARFETWFASTRAKSLKGNQLTLEVPSHYCYELYEDQFFDILSSALKQVFGNNIHLSYIVPVVAHDSKANMKLKGNAKVETARPVQTTTTTASRPAVSRLESNLNPSLTFENYCVAGSNKLPFSIAENISREPVNSIYNPFFLYGEVGVGKTHLMQAIGLRVKSLYPEKNVLFLPMREFQRLYTNAMFEKSIPKFINWFQQVDVLLFDDLQELANKKGTLNDALFPIFNHLQLSGKQLVFTCDRPPMELEGMADRLIDRFKWGIVEKLNKPDVALRKKILTFKAKKNGLELPSNVIEMIANAPLNSVREIEGIVMGMMTRAINFGVEIDMALAGEVMNYFIKAQKQKSINFDMVVEAVAEHYSLNPDVIFSKSKLRDVAEARMVIMYLSQKLVGLSTSSIGHKLGRKHSTVIHGIRTITDKLTSNPELSEAIDGIEGELRS